MLIHSDGNSNIRQGSCFDLKDWIKEAKPNVILMNPPYNGQRIHLPRNYVETWARDKKEDPSKGMYFVKYIADTLNSINQHAKLAVLLPVACAIGTSGEIARLKAELLEENTLDAVFTLPNEIFYPGASASACCMVFKIGTKHNDVSNPDTFFGYFKDDGFKKKKNLGRVEQLDSNTGKSKWSEIEKEWIELYRNRQAVDGKSATHKVCGGDEWLCEAYMKTDYGKLREEDFQSTLNKYFSFLVGAGKYPTLIYKPSMAPVLETSKWEEFRVGKILQCQTTNYSVKDELSEGDTPFVSRTALNNGIDGYVEVELSRKTDGNCITIGAEGIYAFYQNDSFATGNKVYQIRNSKMNVYIAMFLCSVLNKEDYKYSYGRARILTKLKQETIKLPIQINEQGEPVIDNNCRYSQKGYIPDWKFMEDYIKALPYGDRLDANNSGKI